MEYQSEIRDSEINELLEKVERRNYGKYLLKLRLNPIRGFEDQVIKFDFPVTALIGPMVEGKRLYLEPQHAHIYQKSQVVFSQKAAH